MLAHDSIAGEGPRGWGLVLVALIALGVRVMLLRSEASVDGAGVRQPTTSVRTRSSRWVVLPTGQVVRRGSRG